MKDKKKIAIALLLSVIVFIATILVQMMLQQRAVQAPVASPAAQTEIARDPAAPAQPESTEQGQPDSTASDTTNKAVPAAQ